MKHPGIRLLATALVVAGVAAAIAGSVPFERLQSAGALVRRAADFTPERFARYRHVCWFFAVALPAIAIGIRRAPHSDPNRIPPTPLAVSPLTDNGPIWHIWLIIAVSFALRLQRWF